MYKFFKKSLFIYPLILFFVIYLLWLFRAYYDVAYMDQIQILAGNIKNMYNHDTTFNDYYYRTPFLFLISTPLVYLNCKLFGYNTMYENITTGVILLTIAWYFLKSQMVFFRTNQTKLVLSFIVGLIIFSWSKWELSLWGGGFSHYMVVLLGFLCLINAHKFYFSNSIHSGFIQKNFIFLYCLMSVVSTLETTSYFLPFQLSIFLILLINYRLFKEQIVLKKWRITLGVTIVFILFSFAMNYFVELYAIGHPYEAYGKPNLSQNLKGSFSKIIEDPVFVIKFFFISLAGNLIDKDSYPLDSAYVESMPFLGAIVFIFYLISIFRFIRKRKAEAIIPISLIVSTLIFLATVLVGRLGFNDVYYGASSRYSAVTFSGLLGLSVFFFLEVIQFRRDHKNLWLRIVYALPLLLVIIFTLIVDKNQWRIAPYRKELYQKMAQNLKSDENLESLMGYNAEIAKKARQVMIRNKLNVFKPENKLNYFEITSKQVSEENIGFYSMEKDEFGVFRWTNGEVVLPLPNLYTTKDTVKVKLSAYSLTGDTPTIILNDNYFPASSSSVEGGFEYLFVFQEQKVFFKVSIKNKAIIPNETDKNSADTRRLGLIFRSVSLSE